MEILIKSLIISLACTGLRISSDKGMILYFLRWPYEWLVDYKDTWSDIPIKMKAIDIGIYILKPVIGCITCMASVYTVLIELSFWQLSWWTVPTVFIVATMNSIIFSTYNKLS